VLACDVAPRMIEVARRRAQQVRTAAPLEFRVLATEDIGRTRDMAPFDGVLSNFAGLNCVRNLRAVARDLAGLVRPRAVAVFCLFGCFCPWEVCWYLCHGRLRKAFRRFRAEGSIAHLCGERAIRVYYPSVRILARFFAPEFRLLDRRGVGVCVPPSYIEPLAQRFPKTLQALSAVDQRIGGLPFVRSLGDHALVVLEREAQPRSRADSKTDPSPRQNDSNPKMPS
jgi:hypothetical protein